MSCAGEGLVRRRARVDANHTEIVRTLRALGWSVHDTSRVGGGYPDLTCAKAGVTVLVEVKAAKGKLTPDQEMFLATWPGPVWIVRSADDVIERTRQS